jgi:ABC-type bacteriocin/lantibiotic exporter with double-glycine peptidase domain
MNKTKFPFYRQLDYRDCGPTCLRMVAKFHGKTFSREFLRDKAGITRVGVTVTSILFERKNYFKIDENINVVLLTNEKSEYRSFYILFHALYTYYIKGTVT